MGSLAKRAGGRVGAIAVVLAFHAGVAAVVLTAAPPEGSVAAQPPLEVSLIPPVLPPPEPPRVEPQKVEPVKPTVKPVAAKPKAVPPPRPVLATTPTTSDQGLASSAAPVAEERPALPAPVAPAPPVHVGAQVDAAVSCQAPAYPPASRRAGETGAVRLQFLVDTDGQVVDSRIESSSGFARLDEAARDGLSLCHFKPGTVDGRPERSWVRLDYVWKLK